MKKFNDIEENASLIKYNTYRINTSTRYLIKPINVEEVKEVIKYLKDNNIKYYILGKGSNVILSDNIFEGAIVSLEHLNKIDINDNVIICEAGVNLSTLVQKAVLLSLKGLEELSSIPGTVGGALIGNAGYKNVAIYDYIKDVTILKDNEIITLNKEDIDINYRYTEFMKEDVIILSCTFVLEKGNKQELQKVIKDNLKKRRETQPLEYPNAGSVFKNPENNYAGLLIENAGLKGYQINGAKVSEKHANFIINVKDAKGSDIIKLINYIKEVVKEKYDIELELEQRIIKW